MAGRDQRHRGALRTTALAFAVTAAVPSAMAAAGLLVDRTDRGPLPDQDVPFVLRWFSQNRLDPGDYQMWVAGTDRDHGPRPVVRVRVQGFGSRFGWQLRRWTRDDGRALAFWNVRRINTDPCHGLRFTDPGPTVEDLAAALAAQPLFTSTAPLPVRVGGYDGLYLERRLPSDLRQVDCVDASGKRRTQAEVSANPDYWFDAWSSPGVFENWPYAAGAVEQLWVLDVDGQRVVVQAQHDADATPAQVSELDELVRTLSFAGDPA